MKIKIFTVIFLFAVGAEIHCASTGFSPEVMKCMEKHNYDDVKIPDLTNLTEEDKRKISCAVGCVAKDAAVRDGKTMYQHFLYLINTGIMGSNNEDTLKQTLNKCANVGDDECKLMQCLDLFSPPWQDLVENARKVWFPTSSDKKRQVA